MDDTKMEQARALIENAKTTIAHVHAGRQADPHLVQAVEKLAEAVALLLTEKGSPAA